MTEQEEARFINAIMDGTRKRLQASGGDLEWHMDEHGTVQVRIIKPTPVEFIVLNFTVEPVKLF